LIFGAEMAFAPKSPHDSIFEAKPAYPVRQALLLRKGLIEDPGDVFGKKVYEAARLKFNCNESSREIEGYGYKYL